MEPAAEPPPRGSRLSGGGFRRISTALYLRHKASPARILALIELDLDHHTGKVRPTREYARLWGVSHKMAREIVRDYRNSVAEWRALERAQRGHGQGTARAHRARGNAHLSAIRGHGQGTAGAQPGHTTLETETGVGGPLPGGPPYPSQVGRHVTDPDEGWEPPGSVTPAARQLMEHWREAGPARDLIRIRHAEPSTRGAAQG